MILEDMPEPTLEGLAELQRYKDFIAERMRTAREAAGMERFDLAEKSGLPLYWIIDVEAARLSATISHSAKSLMRWVFPSNISSGNRDRRRPFSHGKPRPSRHERPTRIPPCQRWQAAVYETGLL